MLSESGVLLFIGYSVEMGVVPYGTVVRYICLFICALVAYTAVQLLQHFSYFFFNLI
jgi:hypothetical protein